MKYNVGDKVRIKSIDWFKQMLSIPNKLVWQNKLTNDFVGIWCGSHIFKERMFEFLGKTMTIQEVGIDFYLMEEDTCGYEFNDEMIEGLLEEECPQDFIEKYCISCGTQRCDRTKEYLNGCPYYNAYMCINQNNDMEEEAKPKLKFKVGDEVRIKATDIVGTVESIIRGHLIVNYKDSKMPVWPEDVVLLESVEDEISLDKAGQITDFEYEGLTYALPNGYQFVDENDNPINATKISLRKKKEVIPNLQLDSIRTVREYDTVHSRIWLEIYEDNPNLCIFTHLLVDEDHRQKGYGTKALEQAEIIAKDLGCDTIHLKVETNSWMHNWYLRSGYEFLTNAEDNYTWLTKSI